MRDRDDPALHGPEAFDPALTALWPQARRLWTARPCTAWHELPPEGQF